MFPEDVIHCVEWAREKFGKLFTQRPKGLIKIIEDANYKPDGTAELRQVREALKLLKKRPSSFDDCIIYARHKFQKYFSNDIRQLLYVYPPDFKTKEGTPFWSLPKRMPHGHTFDPNNSVHATLITALACLRARIFDVPYPKDFRTEAGRAKIAEQAAKLKVPEFTPSDTKAKDITNQVTQNTNEEKKEEQESELVDESESETLMKELQQAKANIPKEKLNSKDKHIVYPEEFEKDEDSNGHIDLIYSLANSRAANYGLEPMDWITVKLKAGRIIPALATTTAAIAGLQTIELVKLLKKCKLEDMKNAFLNLAVPTMQLGEPGTAPKIKLHETLEVNLWDRWEIKEGADLTLKQLFEKLEEAYKLIPKDLMSGSTPIYFSAKYDMLGKEKEKKEILDKKLTELLDIDKEE